MTNLDLDNPKSIASYNTQVIEIFPPDFFDSLKLINTITESILEPIRIINESMLISFLKSFEDLNRNFGQMLATQLRTIDFSDVFRTYYPPAQIIDAEPIPLLLPAPIKSSLGIHMTSVKTFKFRRKVLKGLSQKNAPGRLMALLMKNRDLFASDEEIRSLLRLEENRNLGWVLRDLKKKFKGNFLKLILERTENPRGYQISDIQYLQ